MRSFYVKSLATALGLLCLGASAQAQDYGYGQPSLLAPQTAQTSYYGYPQVANNGRYVEPQDSAPVPPPANEYEDAMQSNWDGCTSCCDLGACDTACGCRGGAWYGSIMGLYLTREENSRFTLSCAADDDALGVLNTSSPGWDWYGGFDVKIGRKFNCCRNGIEIIYSGLFPGDESATVFADDVPGGLKGAQDFFRLQYNNEFANFWVDNAAAHRVTRDFEMHNVELNLLQFQSQPCSRWSWNWLAGVRFFKFDEDLLFEADFAGGDFAGDVEDVNQLIDVENNLIGFQIGGTSRYQVSRRLSLELGSKLGIYGNHMRHRTFIGGAAGPALVNNIFSSEFGNPVDINSSRNDLAFLGELNAGFNYRLTRHLNATFGYRAWAVTGVALASQQLVTHLDAVGEMEYIDADGSLILHGGYAGLEFTW